MFNTLNHDQQQEVKSIMGFIKSHPYNLDDFIPKLDGLLPSTATPSVTQYTNLVQDMISYYIADTDTTFDDLQDEQLLASLWDCVRSYLTLCKDYIRQGDDLPLPQFVDYVILDFTDDYNNWYNHIVTNLIHIKYVLESLNLRDTKNASTAMFIATIRTAFEFSMNDSW